MCSGRTKQIFSEQGIPRIVRSDNGAHFQGQYRQFAEEYGFSHVTSFPIYPHSNGFIDSQVKSVKRTLKKAKRSNSDPNIALLCLRATPIDNKLPSPAELLLGRQVQDNLPRKIQSDHTHADDVISRLKERQAQQKYYHDQHTTVLPSLVPGQQVTIQNPKTPEWKPAVVLHKIEDSLGPMWFPRQVEKSCAAIDPKYGKSLKIITSRSSLTLKAIKFPVPLLELMFLLTYRVSLTLGTMQIQHYQPLNQSVQTQKLHNPLVQPQEQLSQSPQPQLEEVRM